MTAGPRRRRPLILAAAGLALGVVLLAVAAPGRRAGRAGREAPVVLSTPSGSAATVGLVPGARRSAPTRAAADASDPGAAGPSPVRAARVLVLARHWLDTLLSRERVAAGRGPEHALAQATVSHLQAYRGPDGFAVDFVLTRTQGIQLGQLTIVRGHRGLRVRRLELGALLLAPPRAH